MEHVDVLIIGGGMAGASLAYRLAPHASVVLLEREAQVAYHSTGRSAALYAPQYGSLLIRQLTEASGPFLHALPTGFSAAPVLRERGFLTIGRADQRAELARFLALARAGKQQVAEISAAEARGWLPALRPEQVDWALLDTTAKDMDVDLLLQGFLRGARAHGARVLVEQEVQRLDRVGAGWQVRGPTLELEASVVVNAAGAWADGVAALAGIAPLGLVPHRRTAFIFEAPTGIESKRWPMVADAEERFYLKPEGGQVLGSLAEEVPSPPCDAQPDDYDVAVAVDRIEAVLEFPITRVLRAWTGLRTFGPDRDPVSGFESGVPGFYWHAGLGGYGIQTAPALGEYGAARILGHPMPATLTERGLTHAGLSVERLRG